MLTGFNNNITYKGEKYHIQTENRGLHDPVIVTFIYRRGAIIASKKTNYAHLVNKENFMEDVRKIMEEQHKEMIRLLLEGKFDKEKSS